MNDVAAATLSHFAHGYQWAWDATSLKLAQECKRKYKYVMIDHWTPRQKSPHLLFGGWYAKALERYHKHIAQLASHENALHDVVYQALKETWEYAWNEDGSPKLNDKSEQIGAGWVSSHANKTRENLIRSIIWYLDSYGQEDSLKTVIRADGTPAVEHSFKLEVDDGVILCGHIDRVVEYGSDYYITDNKTTGHTITPKFFKDFNPDTQFSLYTFAGKAILNIPVKGVVIDGAQIAVGFTRFERGFTFRTDDQLNEWYDDVMKDIALTQQMTVDQHFPMNPTACGNYGGCPFRDVCAAAPSVRDAYLKADFVKRKPWNPLEER